MRMADSLIRSVPYLNELEVVGYLLQQREGGKREAHGALHVTVAPHLLGIRRAPIRLVARAIHVVTVARMQLPPQHPVVRDIVAAPGEQTRVSVGVRPCAFRLDCVSDEQQCS
jgi:hypothetical protein